MELIKGNVRVELEDLGEGWSGDYNPEDPDDENLLRFTVSKMVDGEWEQVDDASYCTRIRADTPVERQHAVMQTIMDEVWDKVEHGSPGVKRLCESLSWLQA